ncbi:hypothetical protein [Dokdonia sp.]|uniref:hypothetical protein n=1 Tax=Dokdonia sp. TaxID=2024995 RepID=UPI0032673285
MLLPRTNIHEKLLQVRNKNNKEEDILLQVQRVFDEDRFRESGILHTLKGKTEIDDPIFNLDILDKNRIFNSKEIQKICIDYRLRFLDSKYFKGKYPQGALDEIKYLENKHQITLDGFKVIAPSKMFILEKADDPLLFAPIGNDYFYLVHKWGNDLHPLRKLLMWPYKSFENLIVTIFIISMIITFLVPDGLFTKEQTFSQDIMVFFFMFKSIAAIVLFYGFALGKNFNPAIWNSKYDKTR